MSVRPFVQEVSAPENERKGQAPVSIRLKVFVIVLAFFLLIVLAFAVYSVITTSRYRQLRTDEVSKTIAFESERVGKVIAEMERNAIDLALAGKQWHQYGNRSPEFGISVAVDNFSAFTTAVGGGIWFEPYIIDAVARRVCYYAFFDQALNAVRHDPSFETDQYDYHTQMWYRTISAGLDDKHETVWTEPYFDDTGTNTLMTTVGAGIYSKDGQFLGISTVDWKVQDVVDRLSAIRPTENSFALLADTRNDHIISSTYTKEISHGHSAQNLDWYDGLRLAVADDGNVVRNNLVEDDVEYLAFSRLLENGWLFSLQIPTHELFYEIERRNTVFSFIIFMMLLLLLALMYGLLAIAFSNPLHALMAGVAELGTGNLDKKIEIKSRDEIGMLATAFNKMTADLKNSIEQSAREHAEKERIGAELTIASQIQNSMLPCIFPAFPERNEFDIYASMAPAKEVGGDFYDFFLIDQNTLAIIIADVSGKGVPASLFMVIAKILIKNTAQTGKNPKDVFETVNNLLYENNDTDMFVTAFMGYLDIPSGRFTFVNAGHNPPLLRTDAIFVWLKTNSCFVLGGMKDILYQQHTITLLPGNELFLYTDGVTEAQNTSQELFSEPRLLEKANACQDLPPMGFILALKREIEAFCAGAEQADDITMLALRYQPVEKQAAPAKFNWSPQEAK